MKRQSNAEIWHIASALVTEHGNNATFVAAIRADVLLRQYDVDGHLAWRRIRKAVREILRESPTETEWVH